MQRLPTSPRTGQSKLTVKSSDINTLFSYPPNQKWQFEASPAPYVAIKLSLVDTGKNFNHYLLDTQKLWLANTLRGCKKLKREK